MENQAMQNNSITPVNPIVQIEQTKKNNFLVILLSVLLLISLGITGFFAYQTQKLTKELKEFKNQNLATPTPEPESTFPMYTEPSPDPTANWKTYKNNVLKYTIKYPSDWTLDKSEAELPINDQNSQKLVIYKGEYKLTILWPSAYGPGICLFDDQPRVNVPEMASYCEGEYIEVKNSSGTIVHRRLETPDKYNQWAVYTFDKKYYVTVPPISFSAPAGYDVDQILIMDQILSTYTSLN